MKKSASLAESYVRAADFAGRLAGVQLPSEVWAVFARCDSPRTPPQIARLAKLDEAAVASALRSLTRRKLVQKHRVPKNRMDWQGYLAANGAALAPEAPAVETPPPPADLAREATPSVSPFALPVAFSLGNTVAAIGRRVEARRELRFRIEKTTPRPVAA